MFEIFACIVASLGLVAITFRTGYDIGVYKGYSNRVLQEIAWAKEEEVEK